MVLESILNDQVPILIESSSLLTDFQFGRSALNAVSDFVGAGFETGVCVTAATMDLSKAFDCISHF